MVPRLVLHISIATWQSKTLQSKPWWWMREGRDHGGAWRMVMIFREITVNLNIPKRKGPEKFQVHSDPRTGAPSTRCVQYSRRSGAWNESGSWLFRLVDDRLADGSNLNSVRVGFVRLPNQAGSLDYLIYSASYLQSTSYRSALRSKWWYQNIWQRGIVFPLRDEPFFWKPTLCVSFEQNKASNESQIYSITRKNSLKHIIHIITI